MASANHHTSELMRPLGAIAGFTKAMSYVIAARQQAVALSLKPAYAWYTRQLMGYVRALPIPQHVALILDGNRRFARLCHYPDIIDGHRAGAQKVIDVIGWCDELSIPVVTLWGLSTENLKRERREVDHICQVIGERLEAFTKGETPYPLRRRIRAIGRLELLPEWLQHSIREAEQKSASSGPWLLNVAVAYGGRDELLDAFRMLLRVRGSQGDDPLKIAQELTPQDIQRYLYAPEIPEPDLVIRTSGEVRLSGFFLWQTAFSELYFCDTLWPAFRKIDFLRAIRTFQCRQRRFGL